MDEKKKTLSYVAVAVVLAIIAFLVAPKRMTSAAFQDQGQEFYPNFTDPNAALTLEVIKYDSTTASAMPFKVTFQNGRWIIPSHHDYPADAKDRLAKTAAGMIGIKKDDFRSENVSELPQYGLVDPLDETAGLEGRGTRVTIRGSGDELLADYIFGREVERSPGFRFVRTPGSNRVYACRVDADLSIRFEDWIDTDLLQVARYAISKIVLRDYSIDERTLSVNQRDVLTLTKQANESWAADKMPSGKVVDTTKMKQLVNALDSLSLVGVLPKPAGVSGSLRQTGQQASISQTDMFDMQSKGFYIARDGRLLSNEGEMQVLTKEGIQYTLRFGEVVYGTGAGASPENRPGSEKMAENRYLFLSAAFDSTALPEPPRPTDTSFAGKPDSLLTPQEKENKERNRAHEQWQRDFTRGRDRTRELNDRFADWYYVISADSYNKLRLTRSDLVVSKQS